LLCCEYGQRGSAKPIYNQSTQFVSFEDMDAYLDTQTGKEMFVGRS